MPGNVWQALRFKILEWLDRPIWAGPAACSCVARDSRGPDSLARLPPCPRLTHGRDRDPRGSIRNIRDVIRDARPIRAGRLQSRPRLIASVLARAYRDNRARAVAIVRDRLVTLNRIRRNRRSACRAFRTSVSHCHSNAPRVAGTHVTVSAATVRTHAGIVRARGGLASGTSASSHESIVRHVGRSRK